MRPDKPIESVRRLFNGRNDVINGVIHISESYEDVGFSVGSVVYVWGSANEASYPRISSDKGLVLWMNWFRPLVDFVCRIFAPTPPGRGEEFIPSSG